LLEMETAQEFTARTERLLSEAKALSIHLCNDYAELNRWMAVAKQGRKTWADGLAFAIEMMKRM